MARRDLRILASEIVPIDMKIKFYSIDFPEKWYIKLNDIYKVIKGNDKVKLPSSSLNEAIEALPLGIVETGNLYKNNNNYYYKPWITSIEKLDNNILLRVVKSWCSVELITKENLEEDLREKVINIIESLSIDDISGNEMFLDLSEVSVLKNGTANPDGSIYNILGNYITQEIAEKQIPITLEGETLYFVKHKNRLISFPPKEYKDSYYSVNITFAVKTIAGYPRPILLIDTGISRWANGKYAESIGWKNKTSTFIKYNDNILNSKTTGFTLGKDGITRNYKEQCYVWVDDVKEILEDSTLAYLPEVNEILENSTKYIGNIEDYTLFITYNNENTSRINHPVKKGMSMDEKYVVSKQIIKMFNFLQPIAQNEYQNVGRQYSGSELKGKPILVKYLDELANNQNELNIEILYINKKTPMLIASQILECINQSQYLLEFEDNEEITINHNGLKLNIKAILAGDLIEPMKDFKLKVKETIKFLPKSKPTTLTVIEIKDREDYSGNSDPKFAIRKGLYQSNRFNQFINTKHIKQLEAENEYKLKKAEEKIKPLIENVILELFRQLGVMYDDISLKGIKGMPHNLEIIGFNLLSTNRSKAKDTLSYPVAVSIRTGEKEIYVKTPSNDWMLYSDAIIKLGSGNNKEKLYNENEINTFFRNILSDANVDNALVLVDTSNRLNTILTDFQDKNVKINDMYKEFKNIRLMRVKSNGDVPDIVGVNEEDVAYFISGLKRITENIYYSSEGKGTTYQSIWDSHRKLNSPNKEFKIPGTLEILPVKLNENDDMDSFAYFTHILRQLNITYRDYSSVPLVNHLAKSFQEVLLVKDLEDTDEIE